VSLINIRMILITIVIKIFKIKKEDSTFMLSHPLFSWKKRITEAFRNPFLAISIILVTDTKIAQTPKLSFSRYLIKKKKLTKFNSTDENLSMKVKRPDFIQ